MTNYEQNRRADEKLASQIAEARKVQLDEKATYHFFVAGHTFFTDGMDEPRPIQISTIMRLEHPLLDDHDLDELTANVAAQLDAEAEKLGLKQQGYPTIREVNLLHVVR